MNEPEMSECLKKLLSCQKMGLFRIGANTFQARTDRGNFFIKIAPADWKNDFLAEAKGLELLARYSSFRLPAVLLMDTVQDHTVLVLEQLELRPHTSKSLVQVGSWLAHLHLADQEQHFGFEWDNRLGATRQPNKWMEDWPAFFKEQRLSYQLQLVAGQYQDKEIEEKGEALLHKLPCFFEGISIKPSLLHGDLWQGNTACDQAGRPVLYDPACYYGHHEAELSIMKMFGGFGEPCFQAYHALIPKQPGFQERQQCYQLYHTLNHYHLFGIGYREACLALLDALLSPSL